MPSSKLYGGITRKELDSLRGDLKKEGISLPRGDDVMITGPHGIELKAVYDETRQTLKVAITKKPFFIPEARIWEIVDSGVEPYVGD